MCTSAMELLHQNRSSPDRSLALRKFSKVLSAEAEKAGIPEDQKQDLRSMADWTLRHADYVDPLTDIPWMIRQFKNPPWS
jgi:hypothetical protein